MLRVAQPSLGLQIRVLERELGIPLLIRHSRGVSPTEAGTLLYERSIEILGLVEATRQEVISQGQKTRETVILGLTNGTAALLGRDILRNVSETIPTLQLSVVEEMSPVLVDALERNEVDIALAYDVAERSGLMRIPLMSEEVLFVRSAGDGSEEVPISFADMLRQPLVLPNERDVIRQQLQKIADSMTLPLRIGFEVSSISMLKQMVADGGMASVMPYASVVEEVRRGLLHARRIVDPAPSRTLYLIRSLRRAHFKHDGDLIDYLNTALWGFCEALGDLAEPLPAMRTKLSTVASDYVSEAFVIKR